jgi:hypothetical protein
MTGAQLELALSLEQEGLYYVLDCVWCPWIPRDKSHHQHEEVSQHQILPPRFTVQAQALHRHRLVCTTRSGDSMKRAYVARVRYHAELRAELEIYKPDR